MKVNSLAFRLFATAAGWSLIVLPIAAIVISSLFRQDEQKAFDAQIQLLLTLVVTDSFDTGTHDEPGLPKGTGEAQFAIFHSGWYWQIKPLSGVGKRIVSPSLASEKLLVPTDRPQRTKSGGSFWANLKGPASETLRVAEQVHEFGSKSNPQRYSFAVGGPMGEVNQAVRTLQYRLFVSLALAGLGLMAVTWFQVRFGLLPLRKIERGLANIRSGGAEKLEGDLPTEIEPLQHELNALIHSNQQIIDRARTQVGNLAHALKTPLAVITNEANERDSAFAGKVSEQAGIMRDQVSHYLDRARMAARVGVIGRKTPMRPVLETMVRVLTRIHQDRSIDFSQECKGNPAFQGEKQDLEEMLGNLIDNAGKWAKSSVKVTTRVIEDETGGRKILHIQIVDDGPGLTAEQCKKALKRGQRLDETVPGSGLGLSIVNDLAQSYHGRVELSSGRAGQKGLCADLYLPAA